MIILLLVIIFGGVVGSLLAQQPQAGSTRDMPVFRVGTELVYLPVVVFNKNGERLGNLKVENFKVSEAKSGQGNFKDQKIEQLEQAGQLPLRIGIVIDTSGSVGEWRPFRDQISIATKLIEFMFRGMVSKNRGDKIFIAEFSYENNHARTGSSVLQIRADWSSDAAYLTKTLLDLKPGGWTPLFGSIEKSAKKFLEEARGDFSTILVVISDGYEQEPPSPSDTILRNFFSDFRTSITSAQLAHLSVYTIGTFSKKRAEHNKTGFQRANRNLEGIARLTGGRFHYYPKLTQVPAIVAQVKNDLENRYYLSYKPNPEYKDGEDIKIRVEVGEYDERGQWKKWPNARLLHRDGYRVIR